MSRPRGFIEWSPRRDTELVVNNAKAVLREYRAYLPMTIRQVFYRLVAEYAFDKTEKSYKRLCEYMGKARRAQLIPMHHIRDDGFYKSAFNMVDDTDHRLRTLHGWAEDMRLDRQRGQDSELVIWCEAKGMVPMLEGMADDYGISVASSGGFDSITAQHNMGRYLAKNNGHVLHLGDFDPSGEHVFTALSENLRAFAIQYGGSTEVTRIAVTEEQVDYYNLPTAPAKYTDNRSFSGGATTQLEAFAPDQLIELVREAVESRMDMDIHSEVMEEEAEMQTELGERLSA